MPCFLLQWPFARGSQWPPVNSPNIELVMPSLAFFFMLVWKSYSTNNSVADDLKCHNPDATSLVSPIEAIPQTNADVQSVVCYGDI